MQKLLNMLVVIIWVLAQTITAANSSVHMTPGSQSPLHHSPHHEMTGHGMHADAAAPAGHDQSGTAMPCPASGANKAPDGSSDGNCCDQANCHVVDLVLNDVQLGSRHVEIFGVTAQRSHVLWAPASPFPPPNKQR